MTDLSVDRTTILSIVRRYFESIIPYGELDDWAYSHLMQFQDHPKLLPATGAIGFHRDTQNGGFAQSIWNNRRDMDAVLGAYRTIGGRAIEAIPVIEEAWAFFSTRPLGQSEQNDELPDIEDVFDGDEPQWRDLNSRYFSIPPSDTGLDAVEGAVIHYAIAHAADFAEMAVRAILSND